MLICNVYIQFSGEKKFYQPINTQKIINSRKYFTQCNQKMTMGYRSRHGHLIVDV